MRNEKRKNGKDEEIDLDPEQKELIDKLGIEIEEPEEDKKIPNAFAFRINEEGKPEFRMAGNIDAEKLRKMKDAMERGNFIMSGPPHGETPDPQAEIEEVEILNQNNTCPAEIENIVEPFTDVFEENDEVHIITEMPGIQPRDLRFSCDLEDPKTLYLNAESNTKNYEKTIKLNKKIDLNRIKGRRKHGIIHLAIKSAV